MCNKIQTKRSSCPSQGVDLLIKHGGIFKVADWYAIFRGGLGAGIIGYWTNRGIEY
jgi:hypothetical protein